MFQDTSITTARLVLTPISDADTNDLAALYADREAREYFSDSSDPVGAVRRARQVWESQHFGLFVARKAEDETAVGLVGLIPSDVGDGRHAELIYAVSPAARKNGYARESAEAVINWFFTAHPADKVFARVSPSNERSIKVLTGLGFRDVGQAMFAWPGKPHERIYQRNRPSL